MKNKIESPASDDAGKIELSSKVLQEIRQHARSSMNAEICGVLIGETEKNVTRVTARILGKGASGGGAHVTFTQDAWKYIFEIKDAEYPNLSIVGWYHSHPGFGIFLSDYDLFIHQNFFGAPHQIAWVFDPHSDEEGCFGWRENKIVPLNEITVFGTHPTPRPDPEKKEGAACKAGIPKVPAIESVDTSPNWAKIICISLIIIGTVSALAIAYLRYQDSRPLDKPSNNQAKTSAPGHSN